MNKTSRREFIQTILASVAMAPGIMSMQRMDKRGIPTRPLGSTGERVSIIALGGWDSVANKTDQESIKMMHEALDEGVFFWENAWEYHDGRAEAVMGKALAESGKRDQVFLMSKTCARDYKGAKQHLEDTLRRFKTDHLDLWQFHSIQYQGDTDLVYDEDNGGLKAAMEAKKEGKVRFIGFTGHMHPECHLQMIERGYQWDTVQLPLNICDAHYNSFQKRVLPEVNKRKMGALGMKSLAAQNARIHQELKVEVPLLRKYVLSLPIASLVCGIQKPEELRSDIEVARTFKPLEKQEIKRLLDISYDASQDGQIEYYKDRNSYFGCSYHSRLLMEETGLSKYEINSCGLSESGS